MRQLAAALVAFAASTAVPAASADRPAAPPPAGTVFRDCSDCPAMIAIGPGRFAMGSPEAELEHEANESPVHEVTIARAFAVGRYEVTFGEFKAFARDAGYVAEPSCITHEGEVTQVRADRGYLDPGYFQTDRHPVVCVSWEDAAAYAEWLSRRTGRRYRLPSEAEWEYVARAGTATPFAWGAQVTTDQAHYDGQTVYGAGSPGRRLPMSLPGGTFSANAFGVYDMAGNVWEWTLDCRHDSYAGAPADGSAWLDADTGDCSSRIRRGGSWDGYAKSVRSANRYWNHLRFRSNYDGFRIVAEL